MSSSAASSSVCPEHITTRRQRTAGPTKGVVHLDKILLGDESIVILVNQRKGLPGVNGLKNDLGQECGEDRA
jgi:hypothetical protein